MALPSRVARTGRLPHAAHALAMPVMLILVLLGFVFGGLAYRLARDRQREQQQSHLESHLAARAAHLRATTLSILEQLHAVKSFFVCSEVVERDEFARYTRSARYRHPAIHVMEWIPYVLADERKEHEAEVAAEAQAQGLAEYEIRERDEHGRLVPAGAREAYYPVCYAEPTKGNEDAIGFDVGSEPCRYDALCRAIQSCEAILTDPLVLVQEREGAISVLGFLPVFAGGERDEDHGRESLEGLVLVACRIPDLVRSSELAVADGEVSEIETRLLDADVEGRAVELYATPDWSAEQQGGLRLQDREIHLAGQTWLLQGRPTAAYLASRRGYQPVVAGLSAFLLWELLCGFLVLLGKRARDRETRQQAGFIRSVLQSLTEGVIVADGQGRIQLANDAADRLVGSEAPAATAAQWSSTVGCYLPDTETPYPIEQMPLTQAINGRRVIDKDMYVRKSPKDSGVWLSVSASPIHDEDQDVAGGVVVLRDITERKKSEAAILRLSEAIEQSADAVFITDRRGQIEYVNAAFEETTGYTREEILGQSPRLLGPESYSDEQYRSLWRSIMRGKVYRTADTTRRKDGQLYDVEQTITPIRDAQGRVTHIVSVARDVTEKRLRRQQEFEMGIAAKVQRGLFPQSPPQLAGFDVAGAVFPAAETSGDYYDYIEMPGGGLTLAIGDVSGHGFGPALLMAETRAYLRSLLAAHQGLDTVLDRLNRSLLVDFRTDHFVTLLLAWIDPVSSALVHANAGHVPGYVMASNGDITAELTGTGPILGIFDDRSYSCGEPITLVSGDLVVLLTDGVTETQGEKDTFFGSGPALDVIREHRGAPAREIVERLYRKVRQFSREDDPRDDTTIVVCKVT